MFVNTGLILLVINSDFGAQDNKDIPSQIKFLFGGQYNDLTPEWFNNVGTVLLLTMIVNVFSTPMV